MLKLQNPVLENLVMQTVFFHALGRTRPVSMGKWHKNLFPLRGKRAFFTHMFVTSVYGELHKNHSCMRGSIRLITGPEKSRIENSIGYSVSGQRTLFATQCPLEVLVLFMNRRSVLRMLCKRWVPQPPLIASLDLKSLAHSGGLGAFTAARKKCLNSPELGSILGLSESESKKDYELNNSLLIAITACLFLFS